MNISLERQKDRQIDRQIGRQIDRQLDRQIDRQIERYTCRKNCKTSAPNAVVVEISWLCYAVELWFGRHMSFRMLLFVIALQYTFQTICVISWFSGLVRRPCLDTRSKRSPVAKQQQPREQKCRIQQSFFLTFEDVGKLRKAPLGYGRRTRQFVRIELHKSLLSEFQVTDSASAIYLQTKFKFQSCCPRNVFICSDHRRPKQTKNKKIL